MANSEFPLPDVGEGLTEAEIVSWKVKAGDTVTINQVLVEIETAKSLVELPSPFAGTVAALLVEEGATVEVGTPIISVTTEGDAPVAVAPTASPVADAVADTAATVAPEEGGGAVLVGYGSAGHASSRRKRGASAAAPAAVP
ncbi:MAG: biotin/lipoyl-containing protein, partial [Mycobacteriales bacterium]|nr:biotin/lipoyl-containing protein [Mycobacteriales bacterium]